MAYLQIIKDMVIFYKIPNQKNQNSMSTIPMLAGHNDGLRMPGAVTILTYCLSNDSANLTEVHYNLIYKITRSYVNKGLPVEELTKIGVAGMRNALIHYNPETKLEFNSYATGFIKRAVEGALKQKVK